MSENMESNTLMMLSNAMAEAVARAAEYTYLVSGRQRFPASGIGFGPDLLLTADHVVEREDDIKIVLPDGDERTAQVAGRDPASDLAVLRVEQGGLVAARQAAQPARIGQLALAIGRPTTEGVQASLGVVSALGGPTHMGHGRTLESHIRTDAVPYPGFSGGPLINAAGEVLGLNTSGLARGVSLAIPAALAWQVGQALAEHGGIKRGYLGVRSQLVEISAALQQVLGRSQESGLLLVGVEPDSPAEQSGLLVGDILVGFAGEPVADHDDLVARLMGEVVGVPTPVELMRGGQPVTVNVTVGEMQRQERSPRRRGWGWHR
jgi:S1-C subfamily serine protease